MRTVEKLLVYKTMFQNIEEQGHYSITNEFEILTENY